MGGQRARREAGMVTLVAVLAAVLAARPSVSLAGASEVMNALPDPSKPCSNATLYQQTSRLRVPRSRTASECFNVANGAVLGFTPAKDGAVDLAVSPSWFNGCRPPAGVAGRDDPPSRQLVWLTCTDRTRTLLGAYTAYLHAALLTVAGKFPGVTQICYVSGGKDGRALVPAPTVTDKQWRYTGSLVPAVRNSQWMVDTTCTKTKLYKQINDLKKRLRDTHAHPDVGQSRALAGTHNHTWYKSVFWDKSFPLVPVRHRPLLFETRGETFWGRNYLPMPDTDVNLYRARTFPVGKSLSMHFVNGIAHFTTRVRHNVTDLLNQLARRTADDPGAAAAAAAAARAAAAEAARRKTQFCAFMYNNCFNNQYEPEGMVRVIFFDMLSTYKPCHGLGRCRQTPGRACTHSSFPQALPHSWNINTDVAAACYADYKFVIAMDNQQEEGYVTEKIYNAILAPAVPIYFGAPDLDRYINPEAVVQCHISDAKFQEMREMWVQNSTKMKYRRGELSDEDVLEYGRSIGLEDDLKECVERVVALDQSEELYAAKLAAPVLPPAYRDSIVNTHYDGGEMAEGLLEILRVLDSPLFDAAAPPGDAAPPAAAAAGAGAGAGAGAPTARQTTARRQAKDRERRERRERKQRVADGAPLPPSPPPSGAAPGGAAEIVAAAAAAPETPVRELVSEEALLQLKRELKEELWREANSYLFYGGLSLLLAFGGGVLWSNALRNCFASNKLGRRSG